MAKTYSSQPSSLQPYEFPDELYLAMGRIVRGFAEIEDIVNLTVSSFAQVSESRATVMLGKSPLASRIKVARKLGTMRNDAALAHFDHAFAPPFQIGLQIRNTIAHGTFLGMDHEGMLVFSSNELVGLENDAVVSEAIGWKPEVIIAWGEKCAPTSPF